ncbi:MAG: hypothetical protein AB7S26_41355 [Sandaracinaceae bacterium]
MTARSAPRWLTGVALIALMGCRGSGLGRSVVDYRFDADGGMAVCEGLPTCEPLRTEARVVVEIPPEPPPSSPLLDCDADSVADSQDNCPGIPNPLQSAADCAAAQANCAALARGESLSESADLRGCQLADPVMVSADLRLHGAQLGCASLTLVATRPVTITIERAVVNGSRLDVEGPAAIDVRDSELEASALRIADGATLLLSDSEARDTGVWVSPPTVVRPDAIGRPGIDIVDSTLEATTIYEPPSSRAARVRMRGSDLLMSALVAPRVEAVASRIDVSRLVSVDLSMIGATLRTVDIETEVASIGGGALHDVVVTRCTDLTIASSVLDDVDIPDCAGGPAVLHESRVSDSRFGGGIALIETQLLRTSLLGDGSDFFEQHATLDGVRFCGAYAGATFLAGELRCTSCDATAFRPPTVCATGVAMASVDCVAIQFADLCD